MKHIIWFQDSNQEIETINGKKVKIWELTPLSDNEIFSSWAKHFRNHYCSDCEIDTLRSGTGLSKEEYLNELVFPHATKAPGPSIRAGDFGEILVADFIEFILKYSVPRVRYEFKDIKNESTKGIDIIGYKLAQTSGFNINDELLTFEVKCALSGANNETLINAINGSVLDYTIRKSEALNATKRFLKLKNKDSEALIIERFQNKTDFPYIEVSGAAAVHSNHIWDEKVITSVDSSHHPNPNLILIVFKGNQLMELCHKLYRTASNEA